MIPLLVALFVAPPAPAPMFVAHSTAAQVSTGRLHAFAADGTLTLQPDAVVKAGTLVSLRRADRPLPPWPRGPQIILANGDRIAGEVTGGSEDTLTLTPTAFRQTAWAVPTLGLAAVWVTTPPPDTPIDPADYPWNDSGKRRDAVLLRNGDVVRGLIEGLTADPSAVRIKDTTESSSQVVPLTRVAAFAFDSLLARPRKPKGSYLRIVTADGSRVSLRSATADATILRGRTMFGAEFEVPLAEVIAIDVFQGKAVYLSDLKPKTSATVAFNGVAWPWSADRTVKGANLQLGGNTFDKGIGTHPRTTLTYSLTGRHRIFEASIGLDPISGRRGSAEVRILLDGHAVALPGLHRMTAADPPQHLHVELGRAKELTLVVDYGPGGDVHDDVNWCDARLVE